MFFIRHGPMTDRQTDTVGHSETLTDTRRYWRSALLVADGAAVTRESGDARLTRALTGSLATITTQRSDQMTLTR